MRGILGELPVTERFTHLHARFQLHLEQSNSDNPLRSLVQGARLGEFLTCLRSDELYSQFTREANLDPYPMDQKAVLYRFLLQRWMAIVMGSGSTLVSYIPQSARPEGLLDKVFMAPAPRQRGFALWRRGALFLNLRCQCGGAWNRAHMRCMEQLDLQSKLERKFEEVRADMPENFCRLGFLLNEQEWGDAIQIIEGWSHTLGQSIE
jgi:hypothetical protein